jgi:hypothetical protein
MHCISFSYCIVGVCILQGFGTGESVVSVHFWDYSAANGSRAPQTPKIALASFMQEVTRFKRGLRKAVA